MFTIEQINDLHAKFGRAKTLVEYMRALGAIGVERYDSYLADGHSEYFGQAGHKIISSPQHEVLAIAESTSGERRLTWKCPRAWRRAELRSGQWIQAG